MAQYKLKMNCKASGVDPVKKRFMAGEIVDISDDHDLVKDGFVEKIDKPKKAKEAKQ